MVRLGHDQSLRAKLGEAAERKARSQFDWERKVDRILEIYRDAAALHAEGR